MSDIDDFLCNLIAGKNVYMGLYNAYLRGLNLNGNGKFSCYTFKYPGFPSKTYSGKQLIQLNCEGCNRKFSQLCNELDTIDGIVRILFKARIPLSELISIRQNAMFMRQTARIFTYTFKNPFKDCTNLTSNSRRFCSSGEFLKFFCQCENGTFVDIFSF